MSKGGSSSGVLVRGMAWKDFANREILRDSITQGKLEDFTGNGIALGEALAQKMRLRPGDKIDQSDCGGRSD